MNQEGATVRVIVADDQRVVREGLVTVLGVLPGVEVVAAAADGEQAMALVNRHRPQVVLMDLRMPRVDGIEATRRILAAHPATRVVVLTTYADNDSILAALRAGALGYLTKDAGREEIARALHAAAAGQAILDPAVQARLVAVAAAAPARNDPLPSRSLPDGLSRREAEVLSLIATGRTNTQIAHALVVSTSTVKTHINNIFAKTGIRDRAQAVQYAYRHGSPTRAAQPSHDPLPSLPAPTASRPAPTSPGCSPCPGPPRTAAANVRPAPHLTLHQRARRGLRPINDHRTASDFLLCSCLKRGKQMLGASRAIAFNSTL